MTQLFDELIIDGMTARNRLVRAATAESLATGDGAPSERLVSLYSQLAAGGVGAIITGYAYVLDDGKPSECALSACDDSLAPKYERLVEAAHEQGARIVLQLVYGGSKSKLVADDPRRLNESATDTALPAYNVRIAGPSSVEHPSTGLIPYEANADDLARIAVGFAEAARRAQAWGFDGVEVHVAHGYLLGQFLSPFFNRRVDAYGGSIENRARFACECVAAVREYVGDGFPVIAKLNSSDSRDGNVGLSEPDSLVAAQLLVRAGASAVDVSGDWHSYSAADAYEGPFFGDYGARLVDAVDVPVIVTGGWRDPRKAQAYLSETAVAAIAMCRPLICEPDLPAKWKAGKLYPAKCTSCNYCAKHAGVPCVFNR